MYILVNCRESVASSYVDEDDSDTTSCNDDDPISYNDYMTSRRSSEFTNGTYTSGGRQSVDFVDPEMYDSLDQKWVEYKSSQFCVHLIYLTQAQAWLLGALVPVAAELMPI